MRAVVKSMAQGFLYSHPVGAAQINALLDAEGPIVPTVVGSN